MVKKPTRPEKIRYFFRSRANVCDALGIYYSHFLKISGVSAYALAVLLGITSLPSVTNVLTWKEFAFVQSKLGWLCLILACAHDMFYGWPYIGPGNESCYVPPTFQVNSYSKLVYFLSTEILNS